MKFATTAFLALSAWCSMTMTEAVKSDPKPVRRLSRPASSSKSTKSPKSTSSSAIPAPTMCCSTDLKTCAVAATGENTAGGLPQFAVTTCSMEDSTACGDTAFCIKPADNEVCLARFEPCDFMNDTCCGPATCMVIDGSQQCGIASLSDGTVITTPPSGDNSCCSFTLAGCGTYTADNPPCSASEEICTLVCNQFWIDPNVYPGCTTRFQGDCGIAGSECCPEFECQLLEGNGGTFYRGCQVAGQGVSQLDTSGDFCCSTNFKTCDQPSTDNICNQNELFCTVDPCPGDNSAALDAIKTYIPASVDCTSRTLTCDINNDDCCDGLTCTVPATGSRNSCEVPP